MKTLEFKLEESEEIQTITAYLEEKEVGSIEIANVNSGILAHIEHIEIGREFRGNGFYKMLLLSVFNLGGYSRIISDTRNDYSQPIYAHWLNKEFNNNDIIEITIENEQLYFEIV